MLTIENLDFSLEYEYVIVDLIGKEIMKGKLNGKISTINVNSLSNGIYVLSIKGNDNQNYHLSLQNK